MHFSDSINYDIPNPIKNAKSDSSPFNSEESLSDDTSLQMMTKACHQLSFLPKLHQILNPPSNINSSSQPILQAPGTNHSSDRTRHPSQNQSPSPSKL